jgi:SAM-dependent methyltransferase
MFKELERIHSKPRPFGQYTAAELWTDPHISARMLEYHLNDEVDISSRNTRFIDRSVEWICTRFSIGEQARIADFGCGPGLYATRLAERGAQVTGIDFSARSIDHAGQVAAGKGLSIDYVNRNYLEFDTDARFGLILMIMCDFCALSPAQRQSLLARFHAQLEPGGAVLLDVYSLHAFEQRTEAVAFEPNLMDGFWSAGDYYGFLNTFRYEDEKVVLDQYTIVEADRTRTIYNWLQYFGTGDLAREFLEAGFAVEETLADVAGAPYDPGSDEFAVVARKT